MAPLEIGTLYYVEEAIYKAEKALVAARFAGISLDTKKFDPEKDAKKSDFMAHNPTGKVPYLETDKGTIFGSNAVARYVARCRSDLEVYGSTFDQEVDIDGWMEFALHEVEIPLMTWVYPVVGMMENVPSATKDAQEDLKKAFQEMEAQLHQTPFLVGESVTLADIVLVCSLKEGFKRVFDPNFTKPFPKTCQWFENCCKMPQFTSVLGDVKLCAAVEKPRTLLQGLREKAGKAEKKGEPAEKKSEKKPEIAVIEEMKNMQKAVLPVDTKPELEELGKEAIMLVDQGLPEVQHRADRDAGGGDASEVEQAIDIPDFEGEDIARSLTPEDRRFKTVEEVEKKLIPKLTVQEVEERLMTQPLPTLVTVRQVEEGRMHQPLDPDLVLVHAQDQIESLYNTPLPVALPRAKLQRAERLAAEIKGRVVESQPLTTSTTFPDLRMEPKKFQKEASWAWFVKDTQGKGGKGKGQSGKGKGKGKGKNWRPRNHWQNWWWQY